jgi:Cu(I)/Ag(I) efflux system membrane protein CusA/SilA
MPTTFPGIASEEARRALTAQDRIILRFPEIVPGARSTFAERQTGREYIDIVPDREAIARYGLTVRDVQDVVEAAVGGMPVSTAIAGRARFSINLRYAADQRSDPQALRRILVPVQATGGVAEGGGANTGARM